MWSPSISFPEQCTDGVVSFFYWHGHGGHGHVGHGHGGHGHIMDV